MSRTSGRTTIGFRRRLACLGGFACASIMQLGLAQPLASPDPIEQLLDADPIPHAIVDPTRRYVLLVHERQLLPLERLARPAIALSGQRVDPFAWAGYAQRDYYALSVVDLATLEAQQIPLPREGVIGYPQFAPDGGRFAFTLTRAGGTELWIGDPAAARAEPIADALNAVHGRPCEWAADSRRLLCRVVAASRSRSLPLRAELEGAVERLERQPQLGQPSVLEPALVATLFESQLLLIDSRSGQRHAIGARAAYESAQLAPSGAFILARRWLPPYPQISGVAESAARVVEVLDRRGERVLALPSQVRSVEWVPGAPASLAWIETIAGRDQVMVLAPPFDEPPASRFELPHRFSGLRWLGDTPTALISSYDPEGRRSELWHVDLEAAAPPVRPILAYPTASPRVPLTSRNAYGMDAVLVDRGGFYVQGTEHEGRAGFLDRVALDGAPPRRVWQDDSGDRTRTIIDLLAPDASVLLLREESRLQPPEYRLAAADGRDLGRLAVARPVLPQLAASRIVALDYTRSDGLPLQAELHLPPGYAGGQPLPLIVWAYPRYVAATAPVKPERSDPQTMSFERAFRSFYLLHGYAVLDNVSMPIVGADAEANDTFVEQVVANAGAAIDAAAATGTIDVARVGIAGHSYGAFLVANLLAHSDLFAAGAALSGAYNRTLTPFGFQTERRTLWQAPATYFAMSPLLFSHQIHTPLLLVHGLADDNAGTSPLQSSTFYQAIRGNQGEAKLLLLPWEGHTYRARESVRTAALEMLDWFDRYLKADPAPSR